jgi:hypothetical protein
VAEPQLRCLLCDLILADESTTGKPTEKCRQPGCGRTILAGQTPPEPTADLLELRPARVSAEDETLPEARVVSTPSPRSADIPVAHTVPTPPPDDVPTVQPRSRPPAPRPAPTPFAPFPPRKVTLPEPRTNPPARPQIVTALGVLGCMTVLIVLCIAVIAYSLLYGLKKARKSKAETPTISLVHFAG